MKITIQVNKKDVEIELTADQIKTVNRYSQSVMDRIKTFEDVLEELNITPADFNTKVSGLDEDTVAYEQCKLIVKALNEGWEPDYTDSNQYKYEPRFYDYKPGLGFSRTNYGDWFTYTFVGARLCLKSSELAIYAGTQFRDIYNKYLG